MALCVTCTQTHKHKTLPNVHRPKILLYCTRIDGGSTTNCVCFICTIQCVCICIMMIVFVIYCCCCCWWLAGEHALLRISDGVYVTSERLSEIHHRPYNSTGYILIVATKHLDRIEYLHVHRSFYIYFQICNFSRSWWFGLFFPSFFLSYSVSFRFLVFCHAINNSLWMKTIFFVLFFLYKYQNREQMSMNRNKTIWRTHMQMRDVILKQFKRDFNLKRPCIFFSIST